MTNQLNATRGKNYHMLPCTIQTNLSSNIIVLSQILKTEGISYLHNLCF